MAAKKPAPAAKKPVPAPAQDAAPKLSRHQNFVRLANRRVKKVLKGIEQIGNLSSSNYEYSSEEVDKLAEALGGALQFAIDRFSPKAKKAADATPDLFSDSESAS